MSDMEATWAGIALGGAIGLLIWLGLCWRDAVRRRRDAALVSLSRRMAPWPPAPVYAPPARPRSARRPIVRVLPGGYVQPAPPELWTLYVPPPAVEIPDIEPPPDSATVEKMVEKGVAGDGCK